MTSGPLDRFSSGLESRGVVDPCLPDESRLGADLEAGLVPEDPDDRQYWLWDVDSLEEEKCEDEPPD